MAEDEKRTDLRRVLQVRSVGPLIFGIIACALIAIIILFEQYSDWLENTHDYIVDQEKAHLKRISTARAQTLSSLLSDVSST
jgi:hypothetical protein